MCSHMMSAIGNHSNWENINVCHASYFFLYRSIQLTITIVSLCSNSIYIIM